MTEDDPDDAFDRDETDEEETAFVWDADADDATEGDDAAEGDGTTGEGASDEEALGEAMDEEALGEAMDEEALSEAMDEEALSEATTDDAASDGVASEDEPGPDGPDDDAPLGGLADEIRERRSGDAGGDSGTGADDGEPGSSAGSDDGEPGSSAGPDDAGAGGDPGPGGAPGPGESAGDDAPLGGLADEVRRRRADRDAGEDPDDAFTEMEYEEIASDRLWETLDDEAAGVATGEPADAPADGDVHVIPKRTCETCPHFAEPPTVACTHEGTEILEMVGVDEHKVVDCPMVVDDEVLDDRG